MPDDDLISHPLFQINLMLFLALDIDVESDVTPIFHHAGYAGVAIERNITVPIAVRRALRERVATMNEIVAPDLFLEHVPSHSFVPVECKRSFGAMSVGQALGLLVLNGEQLATIQGKPRGEAWETTIAYLSTKGNGELILEELNRLSKRIVDANFATAAVCSLELSHLEDGVYIEAVPGSKALPDVHLETPVRVMRQEPGFDIRPLYLIPYVSSGGADADPFAEEEFQEQLRQSVLHLLRDIGEETHQYNLDDIIVEAVPVWNMWESRNSKIAIRRYVRDFLRTFFSELREATDVECQVTANRITVPAVPINRVRFVRRYLLKASVRKQSLDIIQTQFDPEVMPTAE